MRAILEAVFAPLDALLQAIPFAAARWCVVAFLLISAVLPFFLSDDYIFLGSPDRSRWRDLRHWALAFMAPYVLIYLLF